jgi:hypothetical protein
MGENTRDTHLEERDEVCLSSLLQRHDGRRLEAEVGLRDSQNGKNKVGDTHLEILGDFTDEALEGELADEELGRLLVATNLAEGDGAGAETMGLLDTAGCVGGLFACCGLCGELEETSQCAQRRRRRRRTCLRGALPPVD